MRTAPHAAARHVLGRQLSSGHLRVAFDCQRATAHHTVDRIERIKPLS